MCSVPEETFFLFPLINGVRGQGRGHSFWVLLGLEIPSPVKENNGNIRLVLASPEREGGSDKEGRRRKAKV